MLRRYVLIGAFILGGATVIAVPVITAMMLGDEAYSVRELRFPGFDVAVTTTVLQPVAEISGMLTVGSIMHLLFLDPARKGHDPDVMAGSTPKLFKIASGVWAASAGALVFLTAFDSNGTPLSRAAEPGAFSTLWGAVDAPRAWTVTFVAALLIFFASMFASRWTGLLIPLWLSAFAILAPVVTGHVLVGPSHDFGGDAAVYQSLTTTAVFGSVLVAAIRTAADELLPVVTLRRLAILVAVGMPVILATDAVITLFKLAGTGIGDTLTGRFIIARLMLWAAITAVWAIAVLLWRRGLLQAQMIAGLLATAALGISAWAAVTVAMTRVPPPQYFVPTSIEQVFMGFEVPDAPTIFVLFTHWRPNLLLLGAVITAITVYLLAVRLLRRRGDSWPVGRTISWTLGWLTVIVVTSSGFGKYSAPDFGVHMVVHMSLNMLAPILMVLGGIVTLLLRATSGDSPWAPAHAWITRVLHWRFLRFVYHPLLVFVLFVGSYYALYFTGIFETLMRYHWGHQLMNVHFLIVGYLYYSLVIGVDRPPRPLPHIGKLGFVLAAMPFHAFFGVILMSGSREGPLVAENFYQYLGLPWADLSAAQAMGGGVAWAGGEIPLMLVVIVLGVQWSRQDSREAKRRDRHFDAGRDSEFDDYNAMLEKLANRRTR
ncbi:cytochrome c oxidase assembly protein [Leucobacter ruminantium]|uniref:Cytochrome c oxidase assembly protein n=1 Tax=Leucobacter ruminantium TaxID=1289170 RepID=A0A939LX38_9MICO|nr:cytochrome c oxidase assembly protein [Leucobacter ruminantium]MBO1804538.1 cytochrome c oxidase assembly protein [Leucobacter ruminantium]